MPQTHAVHDFRRLISESDSGAALYGCAFPGCGATEVRRKGEPSPFAAKRAAKAARKGARA